MLASQGQREIDTMRFIIKPFGVVILITVLMALSLLAFFGPPRGGHSSPAPAATDKFVMQAMNLLAKQRWEFIHNTLNPATMTARQDSLPGNTSPMSVYRIVSGGQLKNPWDIGMHMVCADAFVRDTRLRIAFHARSPEAAKIAVMFEQSSLPYTKSVSAGRTLSPEWAEYSVSFVTADDYKPGGAQVTFHCGYQPGTVEIADVRLCLAP